MKKILFILLMSQFIIFSQTDLIKEYGNKNKCIGYDISPTSDGGYIACGEYNAYLEWVWNGEENESKYYGDIWLLKLDSEGDTVWTKKIGKPGAITESAVCVEETSDKGFLLFASQGTKPFLSKTGHWIIKTDSKGDTLWTIDTERYHIKKLIIEGDNFYVLGKVYLNPPFGDDGFSLAKYNNDGQVLWSNTYGSTDIDEVDFKKTPDGGFVLTGGFGRGIITIKIDDSGNKEWEKKYRLSQYGTSGVTVDVIDNEGYILGGYNDEIINGSNHYIMVIVRIDENGDSLWVKKIEDYDYSRPNSSLRTNDGNVIIAGYSRDYSANYTDSMLFIKINSNGDILWSKNVGIKIDHSIHCNSITGTTDGGFIVTGFSVDEYTNITKLIIAKFTAEGELTNIKEITNQKLPKKFYLGQNYPNPFNPETTIEFNLAEETETKIIIYNVQGDIIKTLINRKLAAGKYKVNLNLNGFPSGIYFYKIITKKYSECRKMIFVK